MTDTRALIAKLEAATEGTRELDCYIALVLGWKFEKRERDRKSWWYMPGKVSRLSGMYTADWPKMRWTTSLDDALTLVPENRMWFVGHMDPTDMRFAATISEVGHIGSTTWQGHHAQAPLAICIAALRARRR